MNDMNTIDIDGIDGGLVLAHANKQFAVRRPLWKVCGPQHSPNSNHAGVTGRPWLEEFGVVITPTQSSAALVLKTLKAETLKKVALTLWTVNGGATVKVNVATLEECTIASIESGRDADGTPIETIRFNATKLKVESFKADGTSSGSVTYDFRTAQAS